METTRYIALLRGINIGGHRVKMERLRELFAELKVENVRTYIQTGNVFFDTYETDRTALGERIERHLFENLGYEVPTFLRTVEEIERAVNIEPFKEIELTDDKRFLITFIPKPLAADFVLPLVSPKNDYEILRATGGEVFSVLKIINGRPSNPVALIEKTCEMKTTSRFFHTTIKILQAAGEGHQK
ncbi:MAG: DUF1697 domain-containing protein [Acidobacteria bacterium]|nr:DUF1697 domain-containing protein [Acidobacteriota bacterium]